MNIRATRVLFNLFDEQEIVSTEPESPADCSIKASHF